MTSILSHPEQFIFAQHSELKTSSLKVAEAFGKDHANVLKAIDKTLTQVSDSFRKVNFDETEYEVESGIEKTVKYRMYEMTKDGFMFLVMGFTGKRPPRSKSLILMLLIRCMRSCSRQKPSPPPSAASCSTASKTSPKVRAESAPRSGTDLKKSSSWPATKIYRPTSSTPPAPILTKESRNTWTVLKCCILAKRNWLNWSARKSGRWKANIWPRPPQDLGQNKNNASCRPSRLNRSTVLWIICPVCFIRLTPISAVCRTSAWRYAAGILSTEAGDRTLFRFCLIRIIKLILGRILKKTLFMLIYYSTIEVEKVNIGLCMLRRFAQD